MIVSFYDNNFKGLQNNASLVIDDNSYSLVKRPIEMDELTCTCEAFTENIQPTFLIVKDKKGNYVYGCLAGIPELNEENKTEIHGTDTKSMLSSKVILQYDTTLTTVNEILNYIFNEWATQVNQNSFNVKLIFKDYIEEIPLTDLVPDAEKKVYNAWEELQSYLNFYNLYLDTFIDITNKEVQFIVGKTMYRQLNIKLWEYGIKNYGKWIADVNECQGYYIDENGNWTAGYKWILTSQNQLTITESKRDIYPIKREVVTSEESLTNANTEALKILLDSRFNENIEIATTSIKPDFETRFEVYVKRGEEKYKDLPCGELHYDASGLIKVQIGYRFTGIQFI